MPASYLARIEADWRNPNVTRAQIMREYDLTRYQLEKYVRAWDWGPKARLNRGPGSSKNGKRFRICEAGKCPDWSECTALPVDEPVMCEVFMFFDEQEIVDSEPIYLMAIPVGLPVRMEVG